MDHSETLTFLRKIEGQIRGIQKMIEEKRYCIDILTQLNSVRGAIANVERMILHKHLESCVGSAFRSRSKKEMEEKAEEIIKLVSLYK